jgi:hypothetical protein
VKTTQYAIVDQELLAREHVPIGTVDELAQRKLSYVVSPTVGLTDKLDALKEYCRNEGLTLVRVEPLDPGLDIVIRLRRVGDAVSATVEGTEVFAYGSTTVDAIGRLLLEPDLDTVL